MTNKEYKERRQTVDLAIAALDEEHLEDREFADGALVEIDYDWHKRIGVICGCFIDPFDGSIQYRYHPLRKSGIPAKNTCNTYYGSKITRA